MTPFTGETLDVRREGEVLEVTLRNPPVNEIGTAALRDLSHLAAFVQSGADGARALIFHSAVDKGFCAGADLRELYGGMVRRREEGATRSDVASEVAAFIDRIHTVFDILDTAPLTTVAAVHGFCFGGGFELALCCDLIVADKSARFCFPELRLGLIPGFGGIPRLRRDLGNAVVRDLLLTGRSVSATRAHEVGLVSQVVARGEALKVARLVAEQATRFDRDTARIAKSFLKPLPRAELDREKEIFISRITSEVVEAALKKFVESDDVRPYLP